MAALLRSELNLSSAGLRELTAGEEGVVGGAGGDGGQEGEEEPEERHCRSEEWRSGAPRRRIGSGAWVGRSCSCSASGVEETWWRGSRRRRDWLDLAALEDRTAARRLQRLHRGSGAVGSAVIKREQKLL
jgi:hypothetical protein